jgi:hypothetical protein
MGFAASVKNKMGEFMHALTWFMTFTSIGGLSQIQATTLKVRKMA